MDRCTVTSGWTGEQCTLEEGHSGAHVEPAEETLRDRFAMAALATFDQDDFHSYAAIASSAYSIADAMLEARKGRGQ